MIKALGASPSRYVWPEAEDSLPMIQHYVLLGVEEYTSKLNRKIEVIGGN
jgi:hypothetical protein